MNEFNGPHFTADLIGPDGKLARLHKGGSPPKPAPPPPPVRESSPAAAAAGESSRADALRRAGYESTISPGNRSLLGSYDQPGTKTLLG